MKKKKNKILKIILGSSTGLIVMAIIIIVPILMLLDFFGANITNGYVENNGDYAEMYQAVVRKNVTADKGYVSLSRILYFYLENNQLTFDMIYTDNLDPDLKQEKPISEVCEMNRYKIYSVCNKDEIEESGQINEVQNKPFTSPLDYDKLSVTSFFMQERIVYGNPDIHEAWDFACPAQTPVYAVCDGKVEKVSFGYSTNTIDTSGGGGNQITISCDVDDIKYKVIYAHLYPNSSTVKEGDTVTQNQKIASVGTTGYSTGNHLHFQVSKDGTTIDGLSLVDFTNTDSTNPYIIPTNPNYGLDNGLYHP